MDIVFKSLEITNFQSIGNAYIQLEDSGTVLVEGINNYEDNVKSNGSGKSSLFSALFWCLYGKTPEGILNVKNRYIEGNCSVILEFVIDANSYKVIRTIKKSSQSVDIYINGDIQSARNKSDSDKLIKDSILQMSPDIFLSLIYLNQGFSSRLSSLTPAARKDRLEYLTNTSKVINELSNKIAIARSEISQNKSMLQASCDSCQGSITSYKDTLSSMRDKLKLLESSANFVEIEGIKYSAKNIPEIQSSIEGINNQMSKYSLELSEKKAKLSSLNSEHRRLGSDIIKIQKDIENYNVKIRDLSKDSICPTCRQVLTSQDKKDQLIADWESTIADLKSSLDKSKNKLKLVEGEIESLKNLEGISDKLDFLNSEKTKLSNILKSIPPPVDISQTSYITKTIEELEEKIQISSNKLTEETTKLEKINIELGAVVHLQQLISKQFRAYLLSSAIEFMNTRLSYYSSKLFSNEEDTITISQDSQKLDIRVGEACYESLSGGEKRRVDLAIVFAQRDLARELSNITSNLLILDEIMESMDEEATQVMLDLVLTDSGDDIKSLYIISHNNYSLPVDSKIIVCKEKNKVSSIRR